MRRFITSLLSLCTELVKNKSPKSQFEMGKARRKHNWKGRQQSDPQESSVKEKTDVVVEIRGRDESKVNLASLLILAVWF